MWGYLATKIKIVDPIALKIKEIEANYKTALICRCQREEGPAVIGKPRDILLLRPNCSRVWKKRSHKEMTLVRCLATQLFALVCCVCYCSLDKQGTRVHSHIPNCILNNYPCTHRQVQLSPTTKETFLCNRQRPFQKSKRIKE